MREEGRKKRDVILETYNYVLGFEVLFLYPMTPGPFIIYMFGPRVVTVGSPFVGRCSPRVLSRTETFELKSFRTRRGRGTRSERRGRYKL